MKIEGEAVEMFRRHLASFREHERAGATAGGAGTEDYVALLWQELRMRDAAIDEGHLHAQSAAVRVMQARRRLGEAQAAQSGPWRVSGEAR